MVPGRGIYLRSVTSMSPLFRTTRIPCRGQIHTFEVAAMQQLKSCLGEFGDGNIMNGDLRNDCERYKDRRHAVIDNSNCPLYCQNLRILQETNSNHLPFHPSGLSRAAIPIRQHSVRMMTTNSKRSSSNDKDEKARLTALRLYRILQRLCGSLTPTSESTILLQNDISASDWGHYHFHEKGSGGDFRTEDQTEELLRLFLVFSGADPDSGNSKLNDWYNDLMSIISINVDTAKDTNNRACWTTPWNLRKAIRFAFHSSLSLPSQSPRELQTLAVSAIQKIQDQVKLWNQSSVSNSQNGLVRVTATSRCLGTVSPVSIAAPQSPLTPKYRFAYRIRVENISSSTTVQLLGRYWHIAEEHDHSDQNDGSLPEPIEVDAPYTGAVGQLPVLQPGQVFEYVSGTDLTTPRGKMSGHLYMATVPPQTRSAKSGDTVTAVTSHASKGSSTSPSPGGTTSDDDDEDDDSSNQTTLFHAIVKPFPLESSEH